MNSAIQDACRRLQALAATESEILVGFSGGKDSLCTLDLCVRHFSRVVPFFTYLVDGLEVMESRLAVAKQRYGLDVLRYPAAGLFDALKRGVYCHDLTWHRKLSVPSFADLVDLVRHETGIRLLATGERQNDYAIRGARIRANKVEESNRVYPLAKWNKFDSLAYLKVRGLPVPESHRDSGGVDLTTPSLLWLYDNHPQDFERLCRVFPFARAVVKRRELYGIPRETPANGKKAPKKGRSAGQA